MNTLKPIDETIQYRRMKSMRRLYLFSVLFFITTISWPQNLNVVKRDIILTIVDQKDWPLKRVKVSSQTGRQSGMTDPSGRFVLKNMTDESSIHVVLPGVGKTEIPVGGLDSIIIKRHSSFSYSYIDRNAENVIVEKINKKASSVLDVPAILEKRKFSSLMELLQAYGGIYISPDGKASVRGVSTFDTTNKGSGSSGSFSNNMTDETSPRQTHELIVFVDGIQARTVKVVNTFLNINDIQTIEVNKSGSGYGLQGSNGVIEIKTKRSAIK